MLLNISSSNTEQLPLCILVDGHSLAYRAYYALSKSKKGALITTTGIPTSVCFGFINSLLQVIDSQQPALLAIAFDTKDVTFRNQVYPEYKGNRDETPEDFIVDLANLQELLAALNLSIVTASGFEADDAIASLAVVASAAGCKVKIVTGDRDLFQLVDEQKNISILYLDRNFGNYLEFDVAGVENKLGIKPYQVVDYKALCGDPSDNIPGIRGIGEKTAAKLLQEYDSIEGIYQNLSKITASIKQKLEDNKTNVETYRKLTQLVLDIPVPNIETFRLQGFDIEKVKPLLEKLQLKTFLKKINQLQEKLGGIKKDKGTKTFQPSLFNEDEGEKPKLIETRIIDNKEKLTELINILKAFTDASNPVAWDTETTSLNPEEADLVGIGCCWGINPTEVAYIPLNSNLNKQEVLSALQPILESAEYPKVLQNTKFDRVVLWYQGIKLAGVVFDTMLASYVIDPEQNHNLQDLGTKYLGITKTSYKELNIPKGKNIADLDIEIVADYCGMDAYITRALVDKLKAELTKVPELYKLLLEVEQPLEEVLAEMEYQGVKIDPDYLQKLSQELEKELQEIEKQAYYSAGEKFNLGSPKQLGELLFDKLGLDKRKTRQTKTGYSTDHATLEKLQGDHPIIDTILQYRTLSKLKSTYVDALPALADNNNRVHTDFNQTITATGRLSSSNPNLQNIPIRTEFSRQIRQGFITQDEWLLVSADYSQIELRILAHLSQEWVLMEAYRVGADVHSVTAKLLLEKENITAEERRLGKIINFGVIYGMGAQKFAREAGVSAEVGKQFIEKYRQRYAKVFAYLERQKKQAIAQGFVTTILGRRRYFNFTTESLNNLRGSQLEDIELNRLKLSNIDAQLLRGAANAPIQGSSADIIKVAMIKLHSILQGYQAKLLLQVHDELVFEVPQQEWEELQPIIKHTMETAVNLTVPLVVDVNTGKNWMEAK